MHMLGIAAGILVAFYLYKQGEKYAVFLFGYLAFLNFQALQALQERSRYGVETDDDWWKR